MLTSLIFLVGVSNYPISSPQAGPLITPYRQEVATTRVSGLSISTANQNTPTGGRLDLAASFKNPFDPTDIAVDLLVDSPSGKSAEFPAYFTRDAKRELIDGKEVVSPVCAPEWRYWWTPRETGSHQIRVRVRNSAGETISATTTVVVNPSADPGFIKISDRDRRFFAFDNGTPYYPIGSNICWGGDKGTFNFDDWVPKFARAGANYGRLWLSPGWSTFSLERKGTTADGKGMGQFDLENLWRLDYVMNLARQNGLRLMITIDSYNILRNKDGYPAWADAPHNSDNGGPLVTWTDFWVSERMDRLYRAKLRYLVARYGANPYVFSWEFWNEVDNVEDFDVARVQAWHQRMGKYLRSIDPYHHLITTSFSGTGGVREIDSLKEIDFIQSHHYSTPDIAGMVSDMQAKKQAMGKPHFFSEIGADWQGPRTEEDPKGMQIHDPLWTSVTTGAAGGAMPWWWDNLIAPKDLYGIWTPVAKFINGIDWPAENFHQIRPQVRFQKAPAQAIRQDLTIENGPRSWDRGMPFNQPRSVKISRNGTVTGDTPISSLLHGTVNHPDKVNPITFSVDLARPTQLSVVVAEVSGYGGAGLRISVDGIPVADKTFRDPDGQTKTDTLRQYNGQYTVTVPAGKHIVKVENPGPDWVGVTYRWKGLKTLSRPPLDVTAIAGDSVMLGWIRRSGRTWQAVITEKRTFRPSDPAFLDLTGMASGTWTVELWDTYSGEITRRFPITVKSSGKVQVPIPSVAEDIAFKIRKGSP
jgi:hypothetical protein